MPESRPSILAGLLVTLACLVLPLAVLSTWTATVVGDTDSYVDTVAPLADDSVVQEAAADRFVALVDERFPLGPAEATVRQAALLAAQGPAFPPVWTAANRVAHRQLLNVLENEQAKGDVTVSLGGLVAATADSLGQGQLSAAIEGLNPTFTVASSGELERARTAYAVLEALGAWLPLVWAALVVLALLVARRRRRILVLLGLGSAATLGLLLVLLGVVEDGVVESVPTDDQVLARAVWHVVTEDLRNGVGVGIGAALLLAVVFAALGLVSRPSRTA